MFKTKSLKFHGIIGIETWNTFEGVALCDFFDLSWESIPNGDQGATREPRDSSIKQEGHLHVIFYNITADY